MTDAVLVVEDGPVTLVTINRPERMNALDGATLETLEATFKAAVERRATRCIVLTGAGKAFVAGADISALQSMTPAEGRAFAEVGHRVFDLIELLPVPVIAAVNGYALGGGCELALACDFVYASEKAKFGLPEVGLGIIPGFGGTQRMSRRVPLGFARELVYGARMIDASEALHFGLANRVVAPEKLIDTALTAAREIAKKSPSAIAAAKRVMHEGVERPLADGNRLEVDAFTACFESGQHADAMQAFLQKKEPTFPDR
jgi:enoyl-CoA hydratase